MDHTIALIQKSHEGDDEARAQIVEENTGLVWCIVRRFAGRGTEMEDLFQIGTIGLLKAIDKFDLSFEVKFSTYAVPLISGEIKRFLRDDGMIKVSRSLKELSYKAYQTQERLGKELGREPSVAEIAEDLKVAPEELTMAMDACTDVESLHRPVCKKEGQEMSLIEKVGQADAAEERVVDHLLLKELLKNLDKDERKLIYLRYFSEKTQTQVGKELGISQVQVSRMEKKILKNLREKLQQARQGSILCMESMHRIVRIRHTNSWDPVKESMGRKGENVGRRQKEDQDVPDLCYYSSSDHRIYLLFS